MSGKGKKKTEASIRFTDEKMREIVHCIDEEDCLGKGGFGQVFKIPYKHQHIVCKRVSKSRSEHYVDEVQVLTSLKPNKNIIGFLGAFADDDYCYVFLEFCPVSLKEKIQGSSKNEGNKLQLEDVANITKAVTEGLHHMHTSGYIHCDLKPENILLGKGNEVKLIDFGATRKLGNAALVGTGEYDGGIAVASHGRDVYALGIILLQLLCCEETPYVELKKANKISIQDYASELKSGKVAQSHLYGDNEARKAVTQALVELAIDCVKSSKNAGPTTIQKITEKLEGLIEKLKK